MAHDVQPVIFYCNPNIYPEEEYLIRKNEITRYAHELGLTIIDDDYDHDAWLRYISGLEGEPERGARCLECFKYRLLRSAQKARELGIGEFTTTLASSRWKRLDQINAAGLWAAEQVGEVHFDDRNWRKGGLQERRNELLRINGFYNQQYCGCEFSFRSSASPASPATTVVSPATTVVAPPAATAASHTSPEGEPTNTTSNQQTTIL